MTARHCQGCRGYTRGWDTGCPGVGIDVLNEFIVPDVVPPLPFLSRLKVLFGLPVFMGVSAGPLAEPFEVHGYGDEMKDRPEESRILIRPIPVE